MRYVLEALLLAFAAGFTLGGFAVVKAAWESRMGLLPTTAIALIAVPSAILMGLVPWALYANLAA